MHINLSCQLQIIDSIQGNKLKIMSQDGRNFVSVTLNSSFIKERLSGPPEGSGPDLAATDWSPININVSGGAVAKTYLISISQLQIAVDQEERAQAVFTAALRGDLESVTSLLASGLISEKNRGLAVRNAAERGYVEIVKLLLASGSISEEDRGLAVRIAAEEKISKEDRGWTVWVEAERKYVEIVKLLIASGSISEEDLGLTVRIAAEHGYERILTSLLAIAKPSIPPATSSQAITTGAGSAARPPDITGFIKAHYDILMAGEGVDPDDLSHVKEFLLCDLHNNPVYTAINSYYINTFATSEDTVLIEAEKAGEIIHPENSAMGARLTTAAVVKGWDLGPASTIVSEEHDETFVEKSSSFIKLQHILGAQYRKASYDEQDVIHDRYEEATRDFVTYVKSHFEEFERSTSGSYLSEKFPARQESIKHSLQSESSASSGRVFLIAGLLHLQTNQTIRKFFPLYCAEDFLAFAKSRNAVILRPKQSAYQEVIRDIQIGLMFKERVVLEFRKQGLIATMY